MTVIIAKRIDPAARGMLKRWFCEPSPNVFVGSVDGRVLDNVLAYVRENADIGGSLVLSSCRGCQGYRIEQEGEAGLSASSVSGLHLLCKEAAAEGTAAS